MLVSSVALASGAYALGTQAGGGSATASDNPRPALDVRIGPGGPPGLGVDGLADRLGVGEEQLSRALRELRNEMPRPDFGELEDELASALGVSRERLREALEATRGGAGDRLGRGLAERRHEVCGPDGPPPPGAPGRFGAVLFLGPGVNAEELAKELGMERSAVKDALDEVAERRRQRFEQRGEEFARELAGKLGIPVERVEDSFPLVGRHP